MFYESLRIVFTNMVRGFLKKSYDVTISIHDVTTKIFSLDQIIM